jgi:hypothetical protein
MIEECHQYQKYEHPQRETDFDAKHWERFIDVAQPNLRMSKQCLGPLVDAAEYWGMDKVLHYGAEVLHEASCCRFSESYLEGRCSQT